MPSMDSLLGLAVGLALSTAAGLRVFVPLLLTVLPSGRAAPRSPPAWPG